MSSLIARLKQAANDLEPIVSEIARSVDVVSLLAAFEEALDAGRRARAIEAAAKAYRALDRVRCYRALCELPGADASDAARWNSELASQLEDLDRLEEAAEALEKAIGLSNDDSTRARLLNRLGTVYHTRGAQQQAKKAYQDSLSIKRSGGDDRGAVNTLMNLAALHRESGEPGEALAAVQQALKLLGNQSSDRKTHALALAAHAALEAGRPGSYFEDSRSAFRAAGDAEGESALLLEQAGIHARNGNSKSALDLLGQVPAGASRSIQARAQVLRDRLKPEPENPILLQRVLEINRTLLARGDSAALLRDIVDAAVELVSAERGFCILNKGNDVEVVAARYLNRESIERAGNQISRNVAIQVAQKGQAVRADNAQDDPALQFQSIKGQQVKSICCVPIPNLGALYVDHRERAGAFGPADQDSLQALANQAAVALTQIRLVEENLRQQKMLEQMNAKLRTANRSLQDQVAVQGRRLDKAESDRSGRGRYDQLIGASASMQEIYRLLDKIESSQETVLITGESGTGKELLARAVARRSPRASGPFVSVNCGALAESLLESELFGHVKGAFTGAAADRPGVFEQANRGTLFLDEIGEMSMEMQKRLLRVLQEREIRRVGDTRAWKVDVRIIAATNLDLAAAVKDGKFREDLFYRLNVIHLNLPPLRERREDIPLLVEHFLERIATERGGAKPAISEALQKRLQAHDWPGNVRELENVVRRAVVLGEDAIELGASRPASGAPADLRPLEEVEMEHIRRVLDSTGGNVTEASRILGIGSATLWRRLRK